MDGACFTREDEYAGVLYYLTGSLERVSVKGARFSYRPLGTSSSPVSQRHLMTFAETAPRLQWLRSDLTHENIAMVQRERPNWLPNVTFVS
jgi:hypothetical protein